MTVLVTGSSGHLGEALVTSLRQRGQAVRGIDVEASACTDVVGSVIDRTVVDAAMDGITQVLHTATLHKPHVVTHSKQDFIDTNISGTLNLLEASVAHSIESFVFTSTTSVFGYAMRSNTGGPATWVDETLIPKPKNIYGITKLAAENLCRLVNQQFKLPVITLRTSRFFPEIDDDPKMRGLFSDANIKASEFLYRRADISDIVSAHELALEKAPTLPYDHYIISATSPFQREDTEQLSRDAASVLQRRAPEFLQACERFDWRPYPAFDRVYDNHKARQELGWAPQWDYRKVIAGSRSDYWHRSDLALSIGRKGYHDQEFEDGPFPVE